jgi:hypothetical protein
LAKRTTNKHSVRTNNPSVENRYLTNPPTAGKVIKTLIRILQYEKYQLNKIIKSLPITRNLKGFNIKGIHCSSFFNKL